ncbi:MAG: CBS domain-containing protein [Gemmatimonadota bacterium]
MIGVDVLARAFLEAHPRRAARKLEQMTADTAATVLRAIPPQSAAAVLREMTVPNASDCLEHLAVPEGAAIVAGLTADEAGAIVRGLGPAQRDPLLAALPADVRDPITRVLSYLEGTAGAVMDPSIFHLPHDVLVADARARLGRAARDLLYYLYVVDREHRLVGVLDIPELMLARARDPVSVVMHHDVDRLSVGLPVAIVREHPGWQIYHAMPVVDEKDRLVGAIRYQMLRKLERDAPDRGADPGRLTARALAEVFQLGTTGVVSAIAGAVSVGREIDGPMESEDEVSHAG